MIKTRRPEKRQIDLFPAVRLLDRAKKVTTRWLKTANAAAAKRDFEYRWQVYALKDELLKKYGHLIGYDSQTIHLWCRSCYGSGIWRSEFSDRSDTCDRCCGTGVYRKYWVMLERWSLWGAVYHRPYAKSDRPIQVGQHFDGKMHAEGVDRDDAVRSLILLALFFSPRRAYRLVGWILIDRLESLDRRSNRLIERFVDRIEIKTAGVIERLGLNSDMVVHHDPPGDDLFDALTCVGNGYEEDRDLAWLDEMENVDNDKVEDDEFADGETPFD